MVDRAPSEILRAIHRLSIALVHIEGLTPFERREIEGALYALSWVNGAIETDPTLWMLPAAALERVEDLILDMIEGHAEPSVLATTKSVALGRMTFIERSQPREAQ